MKNFSSTYDTIDTDKQKTKDNNSFFKGSTSASSGDKCISSNCEYINFAMGTTILLVGVGWTYSLFISKD